MRRRRRFQQSVRRAAIGVVFILVAGFAFWQRGFIEAPSAALHAVRLLAASLTPLPQPTAQIDIPFHRQEHSLSCEIASLRTALLAYGLDVPESELLRRLPFDRTPKSVGVWGDPNKGFVGNVDGKMFMTGYGVYWDPIASLSQQWKRAEVVRNATPQELAQHILAGRPVIVWGIPRPRLARELEDSGRGDD